MLRPSIATRVDGSLDIARLSTSAWVSWPELMALRRLGCGVGWVGGSSKAGEVAVAGGVRRQQVRGAAVRG